MSVKRVAQALDVHRRTVEKYFADGLEHLHIKGKLYTTKAALDRYAIKPAQAPRQSEGVDRRAHRAAEAKLERLGVV